MKITRLTLAATAISTSALGAQSVVGVEVFSNVVVEVDATTAVTTQLGTISGTSAIISGMAVSPSGEVYAIGAVPSELYLIDPQTWTATLIGPISAPSFFEGGLAIADTGQAWIVNGGTGNSPQLLSIDLTNGSTALVGTMTGGAHDINGVAWRPDGKLVAVDRVTNSVVEIDTATAQLTVLAPVSTTVGASGGMMQVGTRWYFATGGVSGLPGSDSLYEFNPTTGASTLVAGFSGDLAIAGIAALANVDAITIGTNYCSANPNSTGVAGVMGADGSRVASSNDLELRASSLPPSSFCFFVVSQAPGFIAHPNGSQGNLCLGSAIGRYVGPGQVQISNASGTVRLQLDLTQTPTPTGFVTVTGGETWFYQAWHRDSVGGVSTSNFTDGLEIQFN